MRKLWAQKHRCLDSHLCVWIWSVFRHSGLTHCNAPTQTLYTAWTLLTMFVCYQPTTTNEFICCLSSCSLCYAVPCTYPLTSILHLTGLDRMGIFTTVFSQHILLCNFMNTIYHFHHVSNNKHMHPHTTHLNCRCLLTPRDCPVVRPPCRITTMYR